MGLIVDTNVFIHFERKSTPIDFSTWDPAEEVYICTVSASELLTGVHLADTPERRHRRGAFVEAILACVPMLDFNLATARVHAEIYVELRKKGTQISAHDLLIAASARLHGFGLLTDNVAEFSNVPGITVVPFAS